MYVTWGSKKAVKYTTETIDSKPQAIASFPIYSNQSTLHPTPPPTMKLIHTIAFVTLVVIAGIDQFKEIFESFGIDFPETPSV